MGTISMAFLLIAFILIVFLIAREFWCWYWKINEIKDLLKSIDQKLGNKNDIYNVKEESNNTEKDSSNKKNLEIKDEYEIISINGKQFAVIKNGNADNLYCPKCYTQVNPKTNSCYKCNHVF